MTRRHGRRTRNLAATLAAAVLLAGCASPGRDLYGAADVGLVIETTEATVIASRTVEVEGPPTAAGPVAGGVTAGGLASVLISGSGLATIAILLSTLAGAGLGYAAEREIRAEEGTEYVLRTRDGRFTTLVQTGEQGEPIPDGTPVLMQTSGRYSRIIEHPDMDADTAPEAWRNPDALLAPDDPLATPSGPLQ